MREQIMGFTSKKHKLDEEHECERPSEEEEEDRISNLPSCVIGYILSFLPTKDVVATSVLSTRWKNYWTLVTRLSITDDLLSRPGNSTSSERLKAEFVDFVYRILLMGSFSGLETFRLHCSESNNASFVNVWLSYVFKSNVQELDVTVPLRSSGFLPSNLYTCRTLVKLKLDGVHMNVPGSVCLPCVKLVDLFCVELPDDDSITRLLSGCPVLDQLKLKKCMGKNVRVIKISVPSLTSLSLAILHREDYMVDGYVPKFHIVLDIPSLSNMLILDRLHEGYVFKNSHQLKMAGFILRSPHGRAYSAIPFGDIHRRAVRDLLQGICKVKNLVFHTMGIDHSCELPTFENLKKLIYEDHWDVTLNLLPKFLERSPQLRSLSAKCTPEDDHKEAETFDKIDDSSLGWDWSRCVPNCLLFHLKFVEIWNFRGLNKDMELVGYFLKNARVLEKLTVEGRYKDKSLMSSSSLRPFHGHQEFVRWSFYNHSSF